MLLRTTYLKIAFHENHLQGIAGPGAPHVYRLERYQNAGPRERGVSNVVRVQMFHARLIVSGVARKDIKATFWEKRGAKPHAADVILRTRGGARTDVSVFPWPFNALVDVLYLLF